MGVVRRRTVLGATAGAIGLAAVGIADAGAGPLGRRASAPLRSDYSGSVGEIFHAVHDGRTVRLRLTAVRDLVPTSVRQRSRCFVLVFAPVGAARAPDAIYVLRRRGVPTHRLFLSSLGTDHAMQAVVNRPA